MYAWNIWLYFYVMYDCVMCVCVCVCVVETRIICNFIPQPTNYDNCQGSTPPSRVFPIARKSTNQYLIWNVSFNLNFDLLLFHVLACFWLIGNILLECLCNHKLFLACRCHYCCCCHHCCHIFICLILNYFSSLLCFNMYYMFLSCLMVK